MAVLVLKLSGPLQSWGTSLKLREHKTDETPSKSGVVGMVAAVLGRRRDADISDLAALRYGVRIDKKGSILRDFQTAHKWSYDKNGKPYVKDADSYIGERTYLQDACFVVGLEGERDLLEKCAEAFFHPVFPPYLGRRSCVPDAGIVVGVFDSTLEEALSKVDNQAGESGRMILRVESVERGDRMRHDNPVSYDFHDRRYAYRTEKDLSVGGENVSQ